MTRIVVIAKASQTVLKDTQASKINLMQPSYVQVAISKEDVASLTRSGNNCIILLKNGQKIIIENFFVEGIEESHTLLFYGEHSEYALAEFDINGTFIDYTPVNENLQIINSATSTTVSTVQQTAVNTKNTLEDDSPSLLKAGLGLLAAEGLYLLAFNKDDDKESDHKNTDVVAPATPKGSLDDEGKVLSGTAEANAIIYITDLKGNILGKATVGSDGSYKIILDHAITDGTKAIVYVVDQAGNKSKGILITGNKDTIAPDDANAQVNESGDIVSGYAEAGAKVYLYATDGTTIIGGPVLAASDGSFSIPVSPALKSGDTAKVIVEDGAGNRSDGSTVEFGKDTLAPNQPQFEVTEDGSLVKGKAEPHSKITITDVNGKSIGTADVDGQGNFEIALNPALAKGDKASISAEDTAGNKSKPVDIVAGQDNIAPETPTAILNTDGTEVSGKAEPGSKIEIRSKTDGSLLGSGTVKEDGTYIIKLSPALTDNTVAKVYASDSSGNQSSPIEIKGIKDTKAPAVPDLPNVYDDTGESKSVIKSGETTKDGTPIFEGKGEANATITIYENGVAVTIVKVDAKGKWTYTPESDLPPGKYSYAFSQTDSAGNPSAKSGTFEFTVDVAETDVDLVQNDVVSTQFMQLSELLIIASSQPKQTMVEEVKLNIQSLLNENVVDHAEIDLGSLNIDALLIEELAKPSVEFSSSQVIEKVQALDFVYSNIRLDLDELQHQSYILL